MSRRSRERRLEAEERWPNLFRFLVCYLGEDWREEFGSIEAALGRAISDWGLQERQLVLKEWRDWNNTHGWSEDVAAYVHDGLSVYVNFQTALEARQLMNRVYDRLIESVRDEIGTRWTP